MLGTRRTPGLGAILVLVVAIAVLVLGGEEEGPSGGPGDRPAQAGSGVTVPVTRVIDGDTVEVSLEGEAEDVRYIGVDTPESVAPGEPVECFGKRASRFNQGLVEGRMVRLSFDDERRDRYGRLLAYVHLGPLFVNAELVRRGYARTLAIAPNTGHAQLFARLQQQAGDAGRGLWAACPP